MPEGQPGEVTLTVQLPADMATRSFGDGTTATTLNYAIYEQDAEAGTAGCALVEGTATFTNFKATVTERLLPGKTYKAAFWAASAAAPYTFNADAMTMTVNTDALKANDENCDGFFGSLENISTKAGAYDVTLTRPFAQVNVGTNDYERAEQLGLVLADATTSLSIPDVPTTLNLFDGTTVTDSEQDADFKIAAIPDGEDFPVAGTPAYKYLAMAYVLMPKAEDKSITTVTFRTNNTAITPDAVAWTNVPVQRNYRTNIYGSLLTNPAQFNVRIDPKWGTPDIYIPVTPWDGKTLTPVVPVTQTIDGVEYTVYNVVDPSQLAWMADNVNAGGANIMVKLDNDMDMGNKPFKGFGNHSRILTAKMFTGTFDGQGHTVKNFSMAESSDGKGVGFIATANNATIKNIKVEGASLKSADFSGAVVGYTTGTCTIDNCIADIIYSADNNGETVGGVIGKDYGNTMISNCKSYGIIVGQKAGGIVGHSGAPGSYSKRTKSISNCQNYARIYTAGANSAGAGGIVGLLAYNNTSSTITNCTNAGVIGKATDNKYSGGIVGYCSGNASLTLTSCNNTAAIVGSAGCGAMLGLLRGQENPIVYTNCSNTGNLYGAWKKTVKVNNVEQNVDGFIGDIASQETKLTITFEWTNTGAYEALSAFTE